MKVVLFCGGLGMRLREHPDKVPKPMVLIGYRGGHGVSSLRPMRKHNSHGAQAKADPVGCHRRKPRSSFVPRIGLSGAAIGSISVSAERAV